MNSELITDLYSLGEISGEAYLGCVENDIHTVQDAIDRGLLNDVSNVWAQELKKFVEEESTESVNVESNKESVENTLKEIVTSGLNKLSVRSYNALSAILRFTCYGSFAAFYELVTNPSFKVREIRNVGRKSIPEIESFIQFLRDQNVHVTEEPSDSSPEESIDYDSYSAIFEGKLKELSVRSFHAVDALYNSYGRSCSDFMQAVSQPDFKPERLPAIGRKSADEIRLWLKSLNEIMTPSGDNREEAERDIRIRDYESHGVKGDGSLIDAKHIGLGHFPYLFAIQSYIESLPDRDRNIVLAQLKIYKNQQLENRKESAKALRISPERMRQLRISLSQKIKEYICKLSYFKEEAPSFVYSKNDFELYNQEEGTTFNENFAFWVMALIWPEKYVVLGDVDAAFANPYGYDKRLALVSTQYAKVYNFQKLVDYFEGLVQEKRVDDYSISLTEIVPRYFKARVYYEFMDDIVSEIKDAFSRFFDFEIVGNDIFIEKNSTRNNTDWAELILRECGHPMTVDEIYEELERRNPGKSKSAMAFAGALRINPNIVPIGRSSTFGLKEWNKGKSRGGTIREFATEYLLSLPIPIAPIEDIGSYVRQFRPSSSDKSIHANLLLEANGSFAVFYKDNSRYIGLSNHDYPDEYRRFDQIADAKRSFRTSCTLLEEFVSEHDRLPFTTNVSEEEKRLARFWNVKTAQYKKGELNEDEASIVQMMIERFDGLKVHKKGYDWQQYYSAIKTSLESGNSVLKLSSEQQDWLTRQIRNYKYRYVSGEHASMIEELIVLLKADADRL